MLVAAGSPSRSAPNILAFRQRLSDLGYREGNNLTFEFAHATDVVDFARGYRELVARKIDVTASARLEHNAPIGQLIVLAAHSYAAT